MFLSIEAQLCTRRDSLLALEDNKMLIYTSFHCKNACFQGKSQCLASCEYINRTMSLTHIVHCNSVMKAFVVKTFCTLYVCTAVLQCSTTLNHYMLLWGKGVKLCTLYLFIHMLVFKGTFCRGRAFLGGEWWTTL